MLYQIKKTLGWGLLGVAALLLLSLMELAPVGQYLGFALQPLTQAIQTPGQWHQQTRLWFQNHDTLRKNNQDLQHRIQLQGALTQEMNSLRAENKQLRKLLGLKAVASYRWQVVRVRSHSPERISAHIIIESMPNIGSDDVLVSDEGLVGIIDRIGLGYAAARTIMDASLAVPVTLKNSTLAALVRGQGDHLLVQLVPWVNAPPVGSILQTSGAGGVFPAGIPVATITHVSPIDGNVFAHVEAEPAAHWHRNAWLAVASRLQQK